MIANNLWKEKAVKIVTAKETFFSWDELETVGVGRSWNIDNTFDFGSYAWKLGCEWKPEEISEDGIRATRIVRG